MRLFVLFFVAFSLQVFSQAVSPDIEELIKQNPNYLNSLGKDEIFEGSGSEGNDKSIDSSLPSSDLEVSEESKIFGFDYIKSIPKSITATSDLPVTNDYLISIGDELRVMLTGGKENVYILEVLMDGSILFPGLGPVNVFGESILDIRKTLESLVQLSYVGTEVSVSLESLAAKKINIIGAVKNPGTYLVSPFSTVISSLAYSGGFEDYASLRNIVIKRGKKEINFDLYDFLIFGNRDEDINIQQGDTILVRSTNNHIEISGSVNRPYTYEFKPNENIEDLISYALGLTNVANPRKIALKYFDKDSAQFTISEINISSQNPLISTFLNPIELIAFSVESSPEFKVKVTGPIENQGFFDVPQTGLLSEIIGQLRFTSNVNPFIGVMQKGNDSKLFSLIDENTQKIYVEENSEIFFFNKNDSMLVESLNSFEMTFDADVESLNYDEFKKNVESALPSGLSANSLKLINDYKLEINFGKFIIDFPFYGKTNALEIVKYLGIELDGIDVKNTSYLSPLQEISDVGDLQDLSFKAEKFNSLTLRSLIDNTIRVKVSGEVQLPGIYVLSSNSTLADLYERIGGLKNTADDSSAIFTRESIRQKNIADLETARQALNEFVLLNSQSDLNPNILSLLNNQVNDDSLGRISGNFNLNSNLVKNFFLEDGDEVFIPKTIRVVSVIGEVMNPKSFIYDPDMSFKSLIQLTGGYTQSALKNSAYVIRSNGEIVRSTSIFQRQIKILPGDTIVVPTNYKIDDNVFEIIEPITSILSNLAFSAAAIDNLRQ